MGTGEIEVNLIFGIGGYPGVGSGTSHLRFEKKSGVNSQKETPMMESPVGGIQIQWCSGTASQDMGVSI